MKKILLIIALIFAIFQMVVMAVAIDIGGAAIDRATTRSPNVTAIDKNNPANAAGIIDTVELWADTDLVNCEVATFYNVGGSNFTTRDTHFIGAVVAGAKRTFSGLTLAVEIGDLIGIHFTGGYLDLDLSGAGYWFFSGDGIPSVNRTFTSSDNRTLSCYGIGATVGWAHKWNTQTISKWNTQEFTKWNDLE